MRQLNIGAKLVHSLRFPSDNYNPYSAFCQPLRETPRPFIVRSKFRIDKIPGWCEDNSLHLEIRLSRQAVAKRGCDTNTGPIGGILLDAPTYDPHIRAVQRWAQKDSAKSGRRPLGDHFWATCASGNALRFDSPRGGPTAKRAAELQIEIRRITNPAPTDIHSAALNALVGL